MHLPAFGSLYTTFFGDAHAQAEAAEEAKAAEARQKEVDRQAERARHFEDLSKFVGWREYVAVLEERLLQTQRDLEHATVQTMPRIQAEIKVLRFALDVVPSSVKLMEKL